MSLVTRPYAPLVVSHGPVGYWRLGDPAGSTVARAEVGPDGTHVPADGAVVPGVPGGIADDPDTATSYPSTANATGPRTVVPLRIGPAGSVELWVDVDAWTDDTIAHGLFQSTDTSLANDVGFLALFRWQHPSATALFYFRVVNDEGEGRDLVRPWTDIFPASGWAHVVGTWGDGRTDLYVDGVHRAGRADVGAYSGDLTAAGASCRVGYAHARPARGPLDEVAVYDRALTADEVAAHYNRGILTPRTYAPARLATLDTATTEGAHVVNRCEVWLEGQPVDEVPVADGKVTYDVTSRAVRSCDVTLLADVPTAPTDPLAPIASELRLFRGAVDYTGERLEEPLGRYAFDSTDVERGDRLVKVSGYDYAALVSDARWERPYVVEGGVPVGVAIARAVESRLSPTLWREPNLETTTTQVPTAVWGEEVDNDPWSDVRSLARGDGLSVSFDREGRLTVASVPDPDTADLSWSFVAGETLTYLGGAKELTGRPYNVVVARGEVADNTPPVEATAEDTNPSSPSFVGRYRRPYFLASSYVTTNAQALRAARGILRGLTGLGEVVTLSVVPHPGLDVWQVLEAFDPSLGVDARYVIDRVELPLRPGNATLTTRRRRV